MKIFYSRSSDTNRTAKDNEIERNALLSDLEKTKQALEIAYAGFDSVTEPDLIDCYIYELNSVMKRYRYLLKQAERLRVISEDESYTKATATPLVV